MFNVKIIIFIRRLQMRVHRGSSCNRCVCASEAGAAVAGRADDVGTNGWCVQTRQHRWSTPLAAVLGIGTCVDIIVDLAVLCSPGSAIVTRACAAARMGTVPMEYPCFMLAVCAALLGARVPWSAHAVFMVPVVCVMGGALSRWAPAADVVQCAVRRRCSGWLQLLARGGGGVSVCIFVTTVTANHPALPPRRSCCSYAQRQQR